jgi:hypothetical protein
MATELLVRERRKMRYKVTAIFQGLENIQMEEKAVLRQKVAHATASMTFDKSQ